MPFELAPLPYASNALEPHIDAKTMEIHHGKHHAAYTSNLNAAIQGTAMENESIETILSKISTASAAVRNNGGGYYNHNLFWNCMAPGKGGQPSGKLAQAIQAAFGSS
jgi:Fe-Mn family superoxide dismutase